MVEISVEEVKDLIDGGSPVHLLDVRQPDEVRLAALPQAEHIPMLELFLGTKRTTAKRDDELVVFCHVGQRSMEAVRFLRQQGFENARSMAGGIDAWAARVDPSLPRY